MKNKSILSLSLAIVFGFMSQAQTAVNQLRDTIREDFNSLLATGTQNTWNQGTTLPSWYAYRAANALAVTLYRADDGTSNSGGLYSYGLTDNTDRALGSLASGSTGTVVYGLRLKNNTGNTITSVNINYLGEQWRVASTIVNSLQFSYKTAPLIEGLTADEIQNNTGFINVPDLNFSSVKLNGTASKLDGSLTENQKQINGSFNLVWKAGEELFIRWDDADQTGSDHGLALDDLEITFSNDDKAAPELLSAAFTSAQSLVLRFNEPINASDATQIANYSFNPFLPVSSAQYNPLLFTVTLSVQAQKGKFYDVTVTNLRDSAIVPNTLNSATEKDLVFNDYDGKDLHITEIMYDNPGPDFLEFVELYNASASPLPLGGLSFTKGLFLRIPEYVLPPDSFVVLSRTKDSFTFYFNVPSLEWESGALGNFSTNTQIVLENSLGQTIKDITYATAGDWSSLAQGNGPSLEFTQIFKNPGIGTSWSPAKTFACIFRGDSVFATPGFATITKEGPKDTTLHVATLLLTESWASVYPNPFSNQLKIDLPAAFVGESVRVSIFSIHNKRQILQDVKATEQIVLHTDNLAPGVYVLQIEMKGEMSRMKLIKE